MLELKNTIEGETVLKNKGETQWTAFVAAREKSFSSPEIPESMIILNFYSTARTISWSDLPTKSGGRGGHMRA